MKTLLLITIIAIFSPACFTTTVNMSKSPLDAGNKSAKWEDKWYNDAFWGLADFSGPIDLTKVCPSGVAHAKQEQSFLAGFVQALTFKLYNPQNVTIYCKDGSHATLETTNSYR